MGGEGIKKVSRFRQQGEGTQDHRTVNALCHSWCLIGQWKILRMDAVGLVLLPR